MSYYLIGIGGTGAKCLEAATHLAACGMFPQSNIYTMFVDPDMSNGSLNRSRETIKRYQDFREVVAASDNLLKTSIVTARNGDSGDVWSPIEDVKKSTMNDIFNYELMASDRDRSSRYLYELLFTKKERSTDLNRGFRGHPAIGAAVIANVMNIENKDPWYSLYKSIANDLQKEEDTKIFITGSIFGGTGASGFPTIAKLIKEHFKENVNGDKLKIGGGLILPYFTFLPKSDIEKAELMAHSEDFLINTQASLKYYYSQNFDGIYDNLYLMSEDKMYTEKNFSIGSSSQKNRPHTIELYAALAAAHFFDSGVDKGVYITGRNDGDVIKWGDLPSKEIKHKMACFTRFAFAFCNVYYPESMEEIYRKKKLFDFRAKSGWFTAFFPNKINTNEVLKEKICRELKVTKDYCELYLRWMKDIHKSSERKMELINVDVFNYVEKEGDEVRFEFSKEGFERIIDSDSSNRSATLESLRDKMCNARCKNRDSISEFIHTIFDNCIYK